MINEKEVFSDGSKPAVCVKRNAEFKGLKSQYLFIFAGGLLAVFVIFVILYMMGISARICIAFGVIFASILVWLTFILNGKYEEHGLMKLQATRNHPRFIINRIRIRRLFKLKVKN